MISLEHLTTFALQLLIINLIPYRAISATDVFKFGKFIDSRSKCPGGGLVAVRDVQWILGSHFLGVGWRYPSLWRRMIELIDRDESMKHMKTEAPVRSRAACACSWRYSVVISGFLKQLQFVGVVAGVTCGTKMNFEKSWQGQFCGKKDL